MKKLSLAVLAAGLVAVASAAYAEGKPAGADHGAKVEAHKKLSPAERAKLKAEKKAEWQKHYDSATPEEQAKMKEELEKAKASHEKKHGEHHKAAASHAKKAAHGAAKEDVIPAHGQ